MPKIGFFRRAKHPIIFSLFFFLFALGFLWGIYFSFGEKILMDAYEGRSLPFLNRVITGQGQHGAQHYLDYAQKVLWRISLWGIPLFLLFTLSFWKKIFRFIFVTGISPFFFSSIIIFILFDDFPSMATKLGLNLSGISYFYLKQHHDGDEELIFRRRPNQLIDIPEFTPSHYSPLFGVEVEKLSFLGQYNQEGFKVDDNADKFKDIVVLGDSMMEISARNENTFAGLLETMTGLTTANYGMSGFGPHQYLETMKRYGLKRKPKFIVFSFFEGNDLWDIQEYKRWKEGTGDYYGYGLLLEPKWKQYLSVMTDIYHIILKHTDNLNEKIRSLFDPEFKQKLTERKNEEEKGILSHLIVLNLPGRVYPDRFFYESDPRRFYQILDSGEGKIFEEILSEFRDICLKEGIVPIVMFVPMKVHVYGAFATNESGSWWNENRLSQMNARDNVEKAVQALCEKLGLGLISLTQPFQQAAREGQVLFYPFDDHWNSEGRGLAARIVRDYLQSIETG